MEAHCKYDFNLKCARIHEGDLNDRSVSPMMFPKSDGYHILLLNYSINDFSLRRNRLLFDSFASMLREFEYNGIYIKDILGRPCDFFISKSMRRWALENSSIQK